MRLAEQYPGTVIAELNKNDPQFKEKLQAALASVETGLPGFNQEWVREMCGKIGAASLYINRAVEVGDRVVVADAIQEIATHLEYLGELLDRLPEDTTIPNPRKVTTFEDWSARLGLT